jgi:hypothetical protein
MFYKKNIRSFCRILFFKIYKPASLPNDQPLKMLSYLKYFLLQTNCGIHNFFLNGKYKIEWARKAGFAAVVGVVQHTNNNLRLAICCWYATAHIQRLHTNNGEKFK